MTIRRLVLASAISGLLSAPAMAERYEITVENLAPADGVFLTPVWIGFHAGDFDLYDSGSPISPELERIAEDGAAGPLDTAFLGADSSRTSVVVTEPSGFAGAPVYEPGSTAHASIELDPATHRYLSYATMVIPSNDAFVANGDPQAVEVFDADGQPTGPVSFTVYGRRVLDAGSETNTETEAAFFDQTGPDQGTVENGVVLPHPGFNGSIGNPDGSPMNILGGSFMGMNFDPLAADFSQSGYQILRVTLRPATQTVRVRVRNLQPAGGNFFTPFWVGFHDGGFDLYDRGAPASAALERLAEDGSTGPLTELFSGNGTDATIVEPGGFPGAPIFDTDSVAEQLFEIDPSSERYVSYASMVIPSNDAFIANGQPRQFQVFDADGQFSPVHFRVTGSMVLDAGTEANTETEAAFLNQTGPDQGESETAGVRAHPGFNGSVANPSGTPVNILGGTNAAGALIDAQIADFSNGNPNMVEITVTRLIDSSFSGAWYDPARAGEGYVLDISERDGQMFGVISGYSYADDGSGEQRWFIGDGPIVGDTLIADLVTTSGGGYFSTSNPNQVIRTEFGTARVSFANCESAELTINATDAQFSSTNSADLTRLTAASAGTISACSR